MRASDSIGRHDSSKGSAATRMGPTATEARERVTAEA